LKGIFKWYLNRISTGNQKNKKLRKPEKAREAREGQGRPSPSGALENPLAS